MIVIKEYLPITWTVLFVGLKNNWLSEDDVISIINRYSGKLNCDDSTLIEINVRDDDRLFLLEKLRKHAYDDESTGVLMWQLASLVAIENADLSKSQKLQEIEMQWSKFGYPEAWKSFIYYMPNENAHNIEELYHLFLMYVEDEKKRLKY